MLIIDVCMYVCNYVCMHACILLTKNRKHDILSTRKTRRSLPVTLLHLKIDFTAVRRMLRARSFCLGIIKGPQVYLGAIPGSAHPLYMSRFTGGHEKRTYECGEEEPRGQHRAGEGGHKISSA